MTTKADFEYWESRKVYERTENKRYIWQVRVVEYTNKLITQKEVKKVWEAVRNIMRKKEPLISVKPHEWVSYIQELFSIHTDRMLEGFMTSYNQHCRGP
jgi:hypothetical protein